jgi:hypothetical protein
MRDDKAATAIRCMSGGPMQGMALACIENNRVTIVHRAADGMYFHHSLSDVFSWKVTVEEMG